MKQADKKETSMAERKPIVVVGSINIDLVANTDRIPVEGETITGHDFQIHPGGKGANQAVAAARLGYPVRMIGRLGDDAFGSQLRTHLNDAGVDLSGVMTSRATSGVAVIVVSSKGENSIIIIPGANALLTPADLDANLENIRSAGLVLAQLEIPLATVEHLAMICEREDVPLMLDPAPARKLPSTLLERITWFTPNETEAGFFVASAPLSAPAEIANSLLRTGVQGVVLKLGAKGAFLATNAGLRETSEPFHVRAIDTTAAGDAFNGAFATGLMMQMGLVHSARFAAAAAAISVTRAGAQPSMPSLSEVQEMLKTQA